MSLVEQKEIDHRSRLISIIEPEFWIQAFFIFFISSLVLHLGQALGLFTLVSHP